MTGVGAPPGCPACGAADLTAGYATGPVPATSTMLMPDRAAAQAVPLGEVTLARCDACGFITNTSFDGSLLDYTAACEDSQASSAVFAEWSRALARDWIDRYDLRGSRVVEIGCGKGDFLMALVEEGVGHGVGIDPAAQPERHHGSATDRIEWITEPYAADHATVRADAVVCRHTLEHVPDVERLVRLMATTHARSPSVAVLVEVPDTLRVVREGAFWDVYHEHCSYFSLSSLTGLFARAGFDVQEARSAYDDQYLLVAARRTGRDGPGSAPSGQPGVGPDAFADFSRRCEDARTRWRRLVTEAADQGTVTVWGASSKAVAFLSALGPAAVAVDYAVDINPRKWGHFLPGTGHPVVPPETTVENEPDLVVVMNPVYLEEIRGALAALGQAPDLLAVGSESAGAHDARP